MTRHPAAANTSRNNTKNPRILQILHTEERGGIETLSGMIVQGLADHGVPVDTMILYPRPDLGALAKLQCVARAAIRLLRDDHAAIIAYQATASILTGICGSLRGCPHRIVHQTAMPSVTAWPLRLADKIVGTLGLYTTNIANTIFTRRQFDRYPARYQRDMALIIHGVALPITRSDRSATRARFSLPANAPVILNVGRMVPQKNQHVLVEALAQVKDAVLVIAGHGPDEAALRHRAQQLGVDDRLHLIGAVMPNDVADLLIASDVFAFPSTWETFGLAAAEAAMIGIAMVVSDLAVLREVLASDNSTVSFVPLQDVDAWAKAMELAIHHPPNEDAREKFKTEITQRYAVSTMTDAYVKLLNG